MARIAFGGFRHETNTFAPVKADLEDYRIGGSYPPLTRGPGGRLFRPDPPGVVRRQSPT